MIANLKMKFATLANTVGNIGANPKAFAFSNPGKLNKQAARSHDVCSSNFEIVAPKLIWISALGQREEIACAPGGSHARRGSAHGRRDCRAPRCKSWHDSMRLIFEHCISNSWFVHARIGRQDNSREVASPSLYEADTQLTSGSAHRRDIQEEAPHVSRMPVRFSCGHDRCGQNRRYRSSHD